MLPHAFAASAWNAVKDALGPIFIRFAGEAMSFETLIYEVADNVATITFNTPKTANALSPLGTREFREVAEAADDDANVRAVVLTGAGKMFCAGGDLGSFAKAGRGARKLIMAMAGDLHMGLSRLARTSAPVVGAINGTAAGAGLSLVMACDLAIAAESAVFTMAYTRAGLTPDGSSTYYMPRKIGDRRARELMLTNRVLSSAEALDWGVVNEVVPDDEVRSRAGRVGTQAGRGPDRGVRRGQESVERHLRSDARIPDGTGGPVHRRSGPRRPTARKASAPFSRNANRHSRGNEAMKSEPLANKKTVKVLGKKIAYIEMGAGEPIVFLHGNPTSSYLWRNVMSRVIDLGRCIAFDLVGMGDSEKLDDSGPESYTFAEHSRYLDAAIDALGIEERVALVVHDWGSALGFHWANRNRQAGARILLHGGDRAAAVSWDEFPEAARGVFPGIPFAGGRTDGAGEEPVRRGGAAGGRFCASCPMRKWTSTAGRSPNRAKAGGRRSPGPGKSPSTGSPRTSWPSCRTTPTGSPAPMFPSSSSMATPGALITGANREFCRAWPNQTEVTVAGSHFVQEDSPAEIGEAIRNWLPTL